MVFQCINIRQVPYEVLKLRPSATVFNTSHGTWQMLMHEKTMFDPYNEVHTLFTINIWRHTWGTSADPDLTAPKDTDVQFLPVGQYFLYMNRLFRIVEKIWQIVKLLTHCCLETPKRVIGKQCRPRSDAPECGIWSGSPLFANSSTFFL